MKYINVAFFYQEHLLILIDGLREFLPDQNNNKIKEAIARLEKEFDYDVSKINHIQLALLKFQVIQAMLF